MMFVGVRWAQPTSRLGPASCPLRRMPKLFVSIKGHRHLICRAVAAGDPTVVIHSQSLSISQTFANLKSRGKVALVPYITAGDPDLSTTAKALKILDSCGADIIELGVPYSDPLADGPVIQAAATRALQNGTNFDAVISMLREVIPHLASPLVLFTYYNPILKHGLENFTNIISSIGIRGLVVPDVPLEETQALRDICATNKIELVLLTTPTTPTERMRKIVDVSEGFVYLVSITGVTGTRSSVASRVEFLLRDIKEGNLGNAFPILGTLGNAAGNAAGNAKLEFRTGFRVSGTGRTAGHTYLLMGYSDFLIENNQVTAKPVAVGFGISKPEHVAQIAGWGADGVIVGSAMVKLLAEANSPEEGLKELEMLTLNLKAALP